MATCSSIIAWKIQWTEEPRGLQSMELQIVGHTHKWAHTRTWNYGKQHAIPIKHERKLLQRRGSWGQGEGVLKANKQTKKKHWRKPGICSIAAFCRLSGDSLCYCTLTVLLPGKEKIFLPPANNKLLSLPARYTKHVFGWEFVLTSSMRAAPFGFPTAFL